MVASCSRVLPRRPSLANFPASSNTQYVCRRSPRSNPIVICFLFLATALFIRHRAYQHAQSRAACSAFSSNLNGWPAGSRVNVSVSHFAMRYSFPVKDLTLLLGVFQRTNVRFFPFREVMRCRAFTREPNPKGEHPVFYALNDIGCVRLCASEPMSQ
jgi:hypothetical protein